MNRRMIRHMAMIDLIDALNLERPLNDEEYSIVKSYARCTDWRVRMAVAENLGIVDSDERTVKLLKKLAGDRNEMVRAKAIESMGERGDASCLEALKKGAASRSYIVRGFSALAAAELSNRLGPGKEEQAASIRALRGSDTNEWVKKNCSCALFLLGERDALTDLLDGLKSNDPVIVKASANCLDRCIEHDPSIDGDIKAYMQANFTTGTAEYDRMMADVMEDELADMLAEEINKRRGKQQSAVGNQQ